MLLADTSAWTNRSKDPRVQWSFDEMVADGQIATCPMVIMELLWTAHDQVEFEGMKIRLSALPHVPIDAQVWNRAMEVFELLAADGPLHHRRAAPPDLLVAAAAESAGVPVLHYDHNFDVIASATGQGVRAIAPFGSL